MPDRITPSFSSSFGKHMFTGIITGVGQIRQVSNLGSSAAHGRRLLIQAPAGYLSDVALGDSIALNGACMTVAALDAAASTFQVDISAESLDKTTGLDVAGSINLEKALRATDRLGGHLVSGHVDGVGEVLAFTPQGESHVLQLRVPPELARFLAYKGSITINGVSLTVNSVADHAAGCTISINLIPHTLQNTALHTLQAGSKVNLEIDLIARYCERMLGLGGLAANASA
jgi:riboflavin synthase